MTMHENRVKVLRSEMERVQGYLAGLPETAWTHQSACDLWEVRHVVAHLSGVSEFYATTVARGLQGDTTAPEGRPRIPEPPPERPPVSASPWGPSLTPRCLAANC